MWIFALFDLPVDTKDARKAYAQFRKSLLKEGFMMLQFSVYARYCESEETSAVYRQRVRRALPPAGQVRVLALTDRQFGKMEVYDGKKRGKAERALEQLALF